MDIKIKHMANMLLTSIHMCNVFVGVLKTLNLVSKDVRSRIDK